MSKERWPVPDRWCWATIEDIAEVVGGGTPKASDPDNFSAHGIPWLTPADLTGYSDAYISRGARDLSEQGLKTSSAKLMPAGSVLFSSRAPIGYCAIASNQISTNQGFKSLVLGSGVDPEFTRLYLLSAKEYAESKASGTTFKEISGTRVKKLAVPLPPLAEQKRIVAKLDRLSARSGKAKEHLAAVQTLATRAKQATLAAAFDLVSANADEPSAEALLAGIQFPKKHKTRRGVPETAIRPKSIEKIVPPLEWVEAHLGYFLKIGAIWDVKDGNHGANHPKKDEFSQDGLPFITADVVVDNSIDYENASKVSGAPLERLRVGFCKSGDVILTHKGTVGRVAISTEECVLSPQTTYYRLNTNVFDREYFRHLLSSSYYQRQLDEVKSQTTRDFVPISKQYSLFLLLPPRNVQTEIVRRIETAFAKIDRMVEEASRAADLLDRLDQQLLAKAFRGELVPQDPNDEPASALLARIHEARANAPKPKRRRKSARA